MVEMFHSKAGAYRYMDVYVLSWIIELATDRFCREFLDYRNDPQGKTASCFTAKTAIRSANVTPASPMNTWTAERTFARKNLQYPSAKNKFFADGYEIRFVWAAIRSAVLYCRSIANAHRSCKQALSERSNIVNTLVLCACLFSVRQTR
jgi:hypothetical protein